jgi:hypothetical protein
MSKTTLGAVLESVITHIDALSLTDADAVITALNGYIVGRGRAEHRLGQLAAPAKRRRGRPRKEAPPVETATLNVFPNE